MSEAKEKFIVQIDEEIKDLIPGYIENRWKDIETIDQLVKKGDYTTIKLLGHSMKGSGAGYGFNAITDIGAVIEDAATEFRSKDILNSLQRMHNYLDSIEIVYITN